MKYLAGLFWYICLSFYYSGKKTHEWFAKYIGLNPRILKQYKKNNDIIYDVIFTAPKAILRDHKRPESKNTFYKGFNLKIVFFLNLLTQQSR